MVNSSCEEDDLRARPFGWMNQLAKCGKVGLCPQVLQAQEGEGFR